MRNFLFGFLTSEIRIVRLEVRSDALPSRAKPTQEFTVAAISRFPSLVFAEPNRGHSHQILAGG